MRSGPPLPLDLRFAAFGGPPCTDLTGSLDLGDEDRAAVFAAAGSGARALWRTYEAGPPVRRIYLAWGGTPAPGHRPYDDSPYARAAAACGALLWTTEPTPVIRFAELYDGYGGFGADHPRLAGAVRDRVLAYLGAAPRLVATTVTAADVLDGSGGVPMDLRTDGVWVWSEGTRHYLERHGLAPDPGLVEHIATAGSVAPAVGPVGLHRAMAAVHAPV